MMLKLAVGMCVAAVARGEEAERNLSRNRAFGGSDGYEAYYGDGNL
jgi:hypothetical protein